MSEAVTTGVALDTAPPTDTKGLVDEKIIAAYFIAALIFMAIAMLAGLSFSLQFLQKYIGADIELLSPGRWR